MAAHETKLPIVEPGEPEDTPGFGISGPILLPAPGAAVHADESAATAGAEAVRELVAAATRAGLIVFRFSAVRGLTFLRGPSTDFLGYSPDELLNDPSIANRVVHPHFRDALGLLSVHLHELDSGPQRLEIPFLSRAGATVFMEVFVTPLYTPQGRVESFAGVAVEAQGSSGSRASAEALVRALAAQAKRA
jgi:PAS domain-containing protein